MPAQTKPRQPQANVQLTLFRTQIVLPTWRDLEHPTRTELVTTLTAILVEHLVRGREPGKGGTNNE